MTILSTNNYLSEGGKLMKSKKLLSGICSIALICTLNAIPVFAEENAVQPDAGVSDNITPLSPTEESAETAGDVGAEYLDGIEVSSPPVSVDLADSAQPITPDNIDNALSMGEVTAKSRSTSSVTQQFTDYITDPDEQKYVQFSLGQGQIVNLTLSSPANDNLNYDLVLASVSEDGSLTAVKACDLQTYVDPDTGKTMDEGISYIHTQSDIGNYAAFVISSAGSSISESFTLTISLDIEGAYDTNEPNDSPFEATTLSLSNKTASASASLHVANDQDWYAVSTTAGVYTLSVDNYNAEIYYAVEGPKMVRAEKLSNGNYILNDGTYYIKVSSESITGFVFGDYALTLNNISKYDTMENAFDFGDWEYAYLRSPDSIPKGQQVCYYKFKIDSADKAYASILLYDQQTSPLLIEVLNSVGITREYGFTGNSSLAAKGVITQKTGLKCLVADIDGNKVGNVGYIRVTKLDYKDTLASMRPFFNKRIYSGSGTYRVSGTASNPGNNYSNVLTLDLSNRSDIPNGAIVDRIDISGSVSPSNVMGIKYMLNPGGQGWLQSSSIMLGDGSIDFEGYNQPVKQSWQFMYSQTALSSTKISNVEMDISWDYDVNQTNYELFQ